MVFYTLLALTPSGGWGEGGRLKTSRPGSWLQLTLGLLLSAKPWLPGFYSTILISRGSKSKGEGERAPVIMLQIVLLQHFQHHQDASLADAQTAQFGFKGPLQSLWVPPVFAACLAFPASYFTFNLMNCQGFLPTD